MLETAFVVVVGFGCLGASGVVGWGGTGLGSGSLQGGSLHSGNAGSAFWPSAMRREAAVSAGSGKAAYVSFGSVGLFIIKYLTAGYEVQHKSKCSLFGNTQKALVVG